MWKALSWLFASRSTGKAATRARKRLEGGPRNSAVDRSLDYAWKAGAALDQLQSLGSQWFPESTISASVKIWGSPQSNMSNLFYLASALASNACPDVLRGFRSSLFSASILLDKKFVQVNLVKSAGGLLGGGGESGRAYIKGPIQDIYYADKVWPFFMADSFNKRDGSTDPLGTVPTIVGSGTPVIATMLEGANPTPQIDRVSRQSDLTALITAALLGSCDRVPCPTTRNYQASNPAVVSRTPNQAGPTGGGPPNTTTLSPDGTILIPLPGGSAVTQSCSGRTCPEDDNTTILRN